MLSALLLSTVLAGAPTGDDLASYEAAQAQAGRDADAHVKLALWCEQHGMTAERAKQLAQAVLIDPKNVAARGLMGLVSFQGHWQRPDAVAAKLEADAEHAAKVKEYAEKRAKAPYTGEAQWKLALWCEENGLKAEAETHLWATLRIDPSRESAWKHLGYKKQGRQWVSEQQLAAAKQERTLQEQADRRWKPLLEKWRGWLSEKGPHRGEAERALASITDPRAVPMVWAVFATGGPERQTVAVQVFGQIDSPVASRDVALLALFSPTAEVRRRATETLNQRDVREFAGLLIGLLRDPIKYQVRPVAGPGLRGELFIEGKKANVKRLYSPPSAPNVALQPGDVVGYDASGLPVLSRYAGLVPQPETYLPITSYPYFAQAEFQAQLQQQSALAAMPQHLSAMLVQSGLSPAAGQHLGQVVAANLGQQPTITALDRATIAPASLAPSPLTPAQAFIPIGQMMMEAQASALSAQLQLANDVQSIERNNAPINELNGRITPILARTSGQDFGTDREAWQKWYVDLIGYAAQPQLASPEKPLLIENVPLDVQPQTTPLTVAEGPARIVLSHSCFGRGTPVRTPTGLRPIESILPGDQVLAQDPHTGLLSFQAVLRVAHNPPNTTFGIRLGDETIVATGIHRLWKAGHGWVMARDLKPGDSIRTIGGVEKVLAVNGAPVQPVFNLEVARGQSFFVGRQGALVHDNSLAQPVTEPFDAPPSLAQASTAEAK